jgi:hypothetical protein
MYRSDNPRKRGLRLPIDAGADEAHSILTTPLIFNRQRQISSSDDQAREEAGIKTEKEVEEKAKEAGTDEYDSLLDEIAEMLEDEEQAEHYVQLGGQ